MITAPHVTHIHLHLAPHVNVFHGSLGQPTEEARATTRDQDPPMPRGLAGVPPQAIEVAHAPPAPAARPPSTGFSGNASAPGQSGARPVPQAALQPAPELDALPKMPRQDHFLGNRQNPSATSTKSTMGAPSTADDMAYYNLDEAETNIQDHLQDHLMRRRVRGRAY